MERKWQLIIFFIAMIILSAGGYGYIISESTAPPEMETYDFGEFTMEIPEDSNVKLAGSDLSLSVYVGDNFQVIKINKTFYENQNELNHILEQTSIENLTNSSRIVETSNNITYYQITDENNIIGFENETYIAINNNNPSNIIIIGSYDLDLLKQITPTIKIANIKNNQKIPKILTFFLSSTTASVVGVNSSSFITICFFLAIIFIPFHSIKIIL